MPSYYHNIGNSGSHQVFNDYDVDECIQGDKWSPSPLNEASDLLRGRIQLSTLGYTVFNLPITSNTLSLFSDSNFSKSSLEVVTSPNQVKEFATAHIVVNSADKRLLENTKACLLTSRTNGKGVCLLTPNRRTDLSFHITFVLPEGTDRDPLRISNFETHLPNGIHQIHDLRNVYFEKISLKAMNGAIRVVSLTASVGIVQTTNGSISGNLETTKMLSLETANGSINVNVGLTSCEGANTKLSAKTTNGSIDTQVTLDSTFKSGELSFKAWKFFQRLSRFLHFGRTGASAPSKREGCFTVHAETMNASLKVAFPTPSPPGSKLDLYASTTNGMASVFLDPAYEGNFDLSTSFYSQAIVDKRRHGTKNIHYIQDTRSSKSGTIVGVSDPHAQGAVYVRTTNGNALLRV